MIRRYRPRRKNTGHRIPLAAIGLTITALILGVVYIKGDDIVNHFKGQTHLVYDNKEANENLELLLAELSGDKSKLLDLVNNRKSRLAWIKSDDTRRRFLWFLLTRLVDNGLWTEAKALLPEVESLAPTEGLERLAVAARERQDYDLQLRLDSRLLDQITDDPARTPMLLRSVRRSAETYLLMKNPDAAVKVIARLDRPGVMARISTPELAAEAAALQMMRAEASTVKEPVLQIVRNILEKGKWPLCPATSSLMIEEVSNALRDNPNLAAPSLREIEAKLLRCRDSMLEYPDREHRLPRCYMMLGELRYRLGEYEGCSQALSLAEAFADGYGEMTPELKLQICRTRSRSDEARGAVPDAMADCRYLVEHETDQEEVLRCLSYLAANSQGADKIELLTRCWDMMEKDESLARKNADFKASIANELAAYYRTEEDYPNAIKWVSATTDIITAAHPDVTDGKAYRARLELALINRKADTRPCDTQAARLLKKLMVDIEALSEEDREKLDAADKDLYRTVVREYARTCLLRGESYYAKQAVKKIKEGLPEKRR